MTDQESEEIFWKEEYSLLTLNELADAAELQPALVEKFIGYGLIEPATSKGPDSLFPVSHIERLRRIMRLRYDLGVNLAGVGVILHMRDQLEKLQKERERLRHRLGLSK
jgi:MerR family transcriptional regulator, heat shock protein HspR